MEQQSQVTSSHIRIHAYCQNQVEALKGEGRGEQSFTVVISRLISAQG
jgi:hypothetical protein